jgi:selenide, water dikinase
VTGSDGASFESDPSTNRAVRAEGSGVSMAPLGIRPLTEFSTSGGCGCKLPLSALLEVIGENSIESFRDAVDFEVDSKLSVVHSLDFGSPVVDDPVVAGQIAVANALSDIYAVGAKPLGSDILLELSRHDSDRNERGKALVSAMRRTLVAAGVQSIGGHTTLGAEYRIGCSVIGIGSRSPRSAGGARVGDAVVLSKGLGTGLAISAVRLGLNGWEVGSPWVESAMTTNRAASDLLENVDTATCTDVTGFGLLGALGAIALCSNVALEIDSASVPIFADAIDALGAGVVPTIADDTMLAVTGCNYASGVSWDIRVAFASPETSGGLLATVPVDSVARLGSGFVVIGRVASGAGVVVG